MRKLGWLLVAVLVSGCGSDGAAADPTPPAPVPGLPRIAGGGEIVKADGLIDLATGRTLPLTRAGAPYVGFGPMALYSATTGQVVYNSWRESPRPSIPPVQQYLTGATEAQSLLEGTPSIRLYDNGQDTELAVGAMSIAWRGTGPLAFVQSEQPAILSGQAFRGRVVVRDSPTAASQVWSSDVDRYTVLAWAGSHLVVQRTPEDREAGGELLIFDGPGAVHSVGPEVDLLAVTADGRYLVIAKGDPEDRESPERTVELWDVARGVSAGPVEGASLTPSPLGAADGDAVVISGDTGLQVFHYDAGRLILSATIPQPGPSFVSDPYFSQEHTHVMGVGTDSPTQPTEYVLIDCLVSNATCSTTPLHQAANQMLDAVRNPSAPLGAS